MPIYEYECPSGHRVERIFRINTAPEWVDHDPYCSVTAVRVISLPAAYAPELTPYYDNGLGKRIESRQQRRKEMSRLGLVEKGTTGRHGASGLLVSAPGLVAKAAPKSGGYVPSGGS